MAWRKRRREETASAPAISRRPGARSAYQKESAGVTGAKQTSKTRTHYNRHLSAVLARRATVAKARSV